jgi:hypothetical protein
MMIEPSTGKQNQRNSQQFAQDLYDQPTGGCQRERTREQTRRSRRSMLFMFSVDCFLFIEGKDDKGIVFAPLPPSLKV